MKNKSDLKAMIKTLLTDLKIADWNVRFFRYVLSLNFLALEFLKEMERLKKFQTLHGKIRLMLKGAGLEGELRDKTWAECVMNVTYLSNII
jgi:hypothetical protein